MSKAPLRQLGHYQLLKILGEGGMGIVYLADDLQLKRKVAVKCLKPNLQDRDDANNLQVRLRREATILAQLNHPNIVQIYDTIHEQNQLALVMEFIDGCNLHKHLRLHIASTRQRLIWLKQITEGLAAAHSTGLIHRDLKADNILINEHGVVKITDFGIAKYSQSDHPDYTDTGKLLGSYSALSPEQALGLPLDTRSDFFSLGIIAFKLMCGRHPFSNSGNHNVLVQNILHLPPLSAKNLHPELSDEVIKLLESLLAKLPEQRPAAASAIIHALDHCINQCEQNESNPNFSDTLEVNIATYDIASSPLHVHSQAPNQSAYKPTLRWLKNTWMGLVTLLVLGATYWGSQALLQPEPLYVAVLPPRINSVSAITTPQQYLMLNVIADGLQHSVLQAKTLHLVNPQELAGLTGSNRDIARATAANVIIDSTLECQQSTCDISISRIQPAQKQSGTNPAPWVIIDKQQWQAVDLDDLLVLNESSQRRLSALFPEHTHPSSQSIALSENDYAQFIKWQHEVYIAGQKYQNILNSLTATQEKYRFYAPFYDLYSYLSIKLYDDSQDERYLQELARQLDIAYKLMPKQLSILRAKVILLSRQEDPLATAAALKQFTQLDAKQHEVLQLSAKVAEQQGDSQQAIRLLTKAVQLRPTRGNLYDLALDQFIINNITEAKKNLHRVLSLNPNDYDGLQLQGHIALGEGNLAIAIRAYQLATQVNPQGHNFSNLGLAYLLKRNFEQAHQAFSQAVELTPHNALHRLNLADSLSLLNQPEQAKLQYQQVITLEAQNSDWSSLINRAQAYGHLHNDAEAIKAVHQSLRLAPDNSDVLFTAALVYSLTDQWSTALVSIEQSLSQGLNPVWYSLPWFDPICAKKSGQLNVLMKAAGTPIRCHENQIVIESHHVYLAPQLTED